MKLVAGLAVTAALFSSAGEAQDMKTSAPEYYAIGKDGPKLPFSEAVRVGDTLYVSGQRGNVPGTLQLVPGGIAAEARQTLENMKAVLERRGSSLDRVVKCTVFLADMKEWPAFNEVYLRYFTKDLPARSALGASGLALGARVEMECIAVVG
jgi:reactive intermediate/imine deaminase